jgi:hypothetical protein
MVSVGSSGIHLNQMGHTLSLHHGLEYTVGCGGTANIPHTDKKDFYLLRISAHKY